MEAAHLQRVCMRQGVLRFQRGLSATCRISQGCDTHFYGDHAVVVAHLRHP